MLKSLNVPIFTLLAAGLVGCATPRGAVMNTPEQAAVMATVHQFVDGFNAGDTTKALAACADSISIIDDFPPHEWHGAGAGAAWFQGLEAYAKQQGITPVSVTLRRPTHVDITGDRAYVVVPADYAYKFNGKLVGEPGARLTVALQKGAAGWRMTAWAWSRP